MRPARLRPWAAAALLALALLPSAAAAQLDPGTFGSLRWRMIGPHRGGRTVAAVGVPGRTDVFYIGVNNGGVWRSDDYGRVWTPIFDDQPTGSIGAIAVAPSDPGVIYVGSGEGLLRPDLSTGDGIYRSADGGKSWTHLGLRDGQQIPMLAVDPRDPNRVFAAVLGHPYGPNPERGIFRSTDGGRSWEKVLYRGPDAGGMDVAIDPSDPRTVYAVLWAARQAPWEIGSSWTLSASNGLFKSTDGGTTWRQLSGGLPGAEDGLGRIGIEVSRSDPRRLYAILGARKGGGLYRSDDAGEHWARVNADPRLWGRDGDFNEVRSDPRNPDVVYVANVVTWKSTDGGKTFAAFRGAPGGDDYHRLWIDPTNGDVILLASDQGAVVTTNGGKTWSSWYNQPTAQVFHVATDNQFPYNVYGSQQESGSVGISSRGGDGAITFREWRPVGVEEYGYVAPDPLNPDLVYGGKVSRWDRRTGQVQDVTPQALREGGYRVVRTQPVVFSPVDPHVLYFASNTVWKTRDGGEHWERISPDLTREAGTPVPANLGVFAPLDPEKGRHRGVVYALAPSPLDGGRIWAGTDDGQIQVTTDGGAHWRNVTPPQLGPWAKVSVLEASRFDTATAYAAVNTFRLDDLRPHVLRTHDGGRTWREVVNGIPAEGIVNVVREDPVRRGLLYAGTERAVYFSSDDGEHWQSLRLNMPATSVRDLVVHDADLVVGTHGRSFWILDDVTPLRQVDAHAAAAPALLVRPHEAVRARWNTYTDTPLPPDEPMGENPPDGAVIDYWLARPAAGPVTLEVLDAAGRVVRRFASTDSLPPVATEGNVPGYWVRPAQRVVTGTGMHRFVWDLHGPDPAVLERGFPISAVPGNTPREPRGPWVLPGSYTVRLTVDGRAYTQPLVVRMDPRVHTPAAGLAQQFETATRLADALERDSAALRQVRELRRQVAALRNGAAGGLVTELAALDRRAALLEDGSAPAGPEAPTEEEDEEGGAGGPAANLVQLNGDLASLYGVVEGADLAPTSQALVAVESRLRMLDEALARWRTLQTGEVAALNVRLRQAGLAPLAVQP
ncbi:MAG: glycoside hydrolase [Gemmatimonadetes bacterium]|nr:glycoside hydrolase [Gemmatimonadota bacterium]